MTPEKLVLDLSEFSFNALPTSEATIIRGETQVPQLMLPQSEGEAKKRGKTQSNAPKSNSSAAAGSSKKVKKSATLDFDLDTIFSQI